MKGFSIQVKFLLPISVIIAAILGFAWFFISWQNGKSEQAYLDRMKDLAIASRMMVHSEAEEYCTSKGLRYHRVAADERMDTTNLGRFEQDAMALFISQPDLQVIERHGMENGVHWMYALAPGRVRDECIACHSANGLNVFGDRKPGSVAAVFDVSGPMDEIDKEQAQMRWVTILAGVGILTAVIVLIMMLTSRIISKPVRSVISSIDAADLRFQFNSTNGDEIGDLQRSFDRFVTSIK